MPRGLWIILFHALGALVLVIIMIVELIAFSMMARWYYLMGPAVRKHRWQTRVSHKEAADAIQNVLMNSRLAWRRYDDLFAVRRAIWDPSTYPRVTYTFEDTPEGTAIICEIKPFMTAWLFVLPALVPGNAPGPRMIMTGLAIFVVAMYAYFFLWEIRRIPPLTVVREGLASIGVRACNKCGYDHFGLSDGSKCPECGTDAVPA